MEESKQRELELAKQQELEYVQEVKAFFHGRAWNEYLLPIIQNAVIGDFPKPDTQGWQEKYVYAFAQSSIFSTIINAIKNFSGKDEFLKRMEEIKNAGIE